MENRTPSLRSGVANRTPAARDTKCVALRSHAAANQRPPTKPFDGAADHFPLGAAPLKAPSTPSQGAARPFPSTPFTLVSTPNSSSFERSYTGLDTAASSSAAAARAGWPPAASSHRALRLEDADSLSDGSADYSPRGAALPRSRLFSPRDGPSPSPVARRRRQRDAAALMEEESSMRDSLERRSPFPGAASPPRRDHGAAEGAASAAPQRQGPPRRRAPYGFGSARRAAPSPEPSPRARAAPLPDASGFLDGSWEAPAAVCPPTPVRGESTWSGGGDVPFPPAPVRMNSLEENKVLSLLAAARGAAGGAAGPGPASGSFAKDFVNEGVIGAGASALVFRCRRRLDGGVCAVKRSRKPFRGRQERSFLLQEVQTLQHVGAHRNVVGLALAWQEHGYVYTQYELCLRGNVAELVGGALSPPPEATVWRMLADAATGLRHVHESGWVHVDVKPANLLVSEDGTVKVGDFGMAQRSGSPGDGAEGDSLYMAKELLRCARVSPRADVFSLGIGFLEVAFGAKLPHEGERWHALRAGGPVAELLAPRADRSDALREAVAAMMREDPAARLGLEALLEAPHARRAAAMAGQQDEWIVRQPLPVPPAPEGKMNRMGRAPSWDADIMQIDAS